MINVFPAQSRYTADHGWLRSNFSFSFAEYYDPKNMNFGPMRVLNDDIVQPARGFGMHPHRDMEIVTILLKGQLQHQDTTGNTEVLRPGEVQRMSAGTGLYHSEVNPSPTEEVNFLQMWFEPLERGITPSYEQTAYDQAAMKNSLLPIVSSKHQGAGIASIHQDMTIYLSELVAGNTLSFEQKPDRGIFLFVMEGEITLNGTDKLQHRDSARITDLEQLNVLAESNAYFMLIDLPMTF